MHSNIPQGYGCILAATIVDVANNTNMQVCLFNPHSYPVVVRQDSIVGQMGKPVDGVNTISR